MESVGTYGGWIGQTAYDKNGEKLGRIEQIYYDDQTTRPEWITISTGMFGTKTNFAPIGGSTAYEDGLRLNVFQEQVKDAPKIDANGALTMEEEQTLYSHYGYDWSNTAGFEDRTDRLDRDYVVERPLDETVSEPVVTEGVIAAPEGEVVEEVEVHGERVQKIPTEGRLRIRKYTVTEMVPMSQEKVVIEREGEVIAEDLTNTTVTDSTVTDRPVT